MSNWGRACVGKIFPTTLDDSNAPKEDTYGVYQVYDLILRHYEAEEWTLDDFKNFRRILSNCPVNDFIQYRELICYFLSLSPSDARREILELDQALDFCLFNKKVQIVETDPETDQIINRYDKVVDCDYTVGDIVEIVKRIYGTFRSLITNCMVSTINDSSSTMNEKLTYCEELLNPLSEERSLLVDAIRQKCGQLFEDVSIPGVLSYIHNLCGQIDSNLLEALNSYYQKEGSKLARMERSEIAAYKIASKTEWEIYHAKKQKHGKRGYGQWRHD